MWSLQNNRLIWFESTENYFYLSVFNNQHLSKKTRKQLKFIWVVPQFSHISVFKKLFIHHYWSFDWFFDNIKQDLCKLKKLSENIKSINLFIVISSLLKNYQIFIFFSNNSLLKSINKRIEKCFINNETFSISVFIIFSQN